MGKGPHGGLLYATHYQFSWHIYAFLKVFGVLRTFLQKGSKPPEAVPPFPYKLQFSLPNKFNNITLYKHPFPWYNKALTQKGCDPI